MNPRVLSNKKEKKTANLARSLTLNRAPKRVIIIRLKIKNSMTNEKTKAILSSFIAD